MLFSPALLTLDPALGRLDHSSLSQQTQMEILIGGITENKEKICGYGDEPKELSEWTRVNLNKTSEVQGINWIGLRLKGSIELQWIPSTVKHFTVTTNKLSGTVDLTCLPSVLEDLSLAENTFEGTVDLTKLPCGLKTLRLYGNNFSGLTDFSHLPASLGTLLLSDTHLEGEVFAFNGRLSVDYSSVKDMRS